MAIDLVLINKINKQLTSDGVNSLCHHVQESINCRGIDCNDCPLADSIHDYKKIQKRIDMLDLVLPEY